MVDKATVRQCRPQKLPETPFHPVAHHRIANLLGDSDAIARPFAAIGLREQHKPGARIASPGGRKLVRARRRRGRKSLTA